MSMSGWWFIASAASATFCTRVIPARNEGAFTSRVIASPSWCHADRSPARARSISSCGSSAIVRASPWVVPPGSTTSDLVAAGAVLRAQADLRTEPDHRVVLAVDHPFLHRDDRVVGDVDALRAHFGAALGDVAHA